MSNETLVRELVPLAAELIGTVRDYGPEDVAAVLARVPAARHDALAVVLAAMVDPDQTPAKLLAWIEAGPVQSRDKEYPTRKGVGGRVAAPREHGTERGYQQHRHRREMPACDACLTAHREHARAKAACATPVLDSRALVAVS